MAVDFSETLIVAISASALFDLSDTDSARSKFVADNPVTASDKLQDYLLAKENDPLNAGTGYPLIKTLLNLNRFDSHKAFDDESPLVEVVIISKSTPNLGIRVLNAIRAHGLPITRSAFISGGNVADYIADFKVDLFLTTNQDDAQMVSDREVCACAIVDATPATAHDLDSEQLRIAFDGDAVLFDEYSELIYQTQGLKAFHDYEVAMADNLIDKGAFADFLIKLSKLQHKLPTANGEIAPICIALVTARNAPADMRAIKTLRAWGVSVDMAFFLGGIEKTHVLKTFAPHIFFDDSVKHIDLARPFVPSARVPYRSSSPLADNSALEELRQSTYKPSNYRHKKDKKGQ